MFNYWESLKTARGRAGKIFRAGPARPYLRATGATPGISKGWRSGKRGARGLKNSLDRRFSILAPFSGLQDSASLLEQSPIPGVFHGPYCHFWEMVIAKTGKWERMMKGSLSEKPFKIVSYAVSGEGTEIALMIGKTSDFASEGRDGAEV